VVRPRRTTTMQAGGRTPRQAPTTRLTHLVPPPFHPVQWPSPNARGCRVSVRTIYAPCTTRSVRSTHTPSPMPSICTSRRRFASPPPAAGRDRQVSVVSGDERPRRSPTGGCHAQPGPFRRRCVSTGDQRRAAELRGRALGSGRSARSSTPRGGVAGGGIVRSPRARWRARRRLRHVPFREVGQFRATVTTVRTPHHHGRRHPP
jgi:hypothetical protein